MSFDIPDWDGGSFSYYLDEAPPLKEFGTRNTGDQLKRKKKRKKNKANAEENINRRETDENLSSPKKNLEKEDTITANYVKEKEARISGLQTENCSEKTVTPPKETGKQGVIQSIGIVNNKKAKKKNCNKRNKYKELADRQRQAKEGREVCGFKKGKAIFSASSSLPGVISGASLNTDCKKSENTKTPKNVCVSNSDIDDTWADKKCRDITKTPQLIVKQDSLTDISPATNQQKPVLDAIDCNGEIEMNSHGESAQVKSCGKIKKAKKQNVKQKVSDGVVLSGGLDGGSDNDRGDKANKKATSRKPKVRESEPDVEIICEISDDEAGQDQTLQRDLEAFIDVLNLAQFSKKKIKKSKEDCYVVVDDSVTLSPKGIQEEPSYIKEKDERNSQNLEILESKSDQGKEIVRDSIPEHQEGGHAKEKKKRKRKRKKNQEINVNESIVSVSENTSVVGNDFVNEEEEESNNVTKEGSMIEENKDKNKKDTHKDEKTPSELSIGDQIIEPLENRKKKRKRKSSQTEEVHKSTSSRIESEMLQFY